MSEKAYINTLEKYEELVNAGVPEAQAKAHVHALNSSFDGYVTENYLSNSLNSLESRLKVFFFYLMLVFFIIPLTLGVSITAINKWFF